MVASYEKATDYLSSLGGLPSKIIDDTLELAETTSDPEVMETLSSSNDWRVRSRVAKKPNIKIETLKKLALDGDYLVRISALQNDNASMAMIQDMISDPDILVRKCATLALKIKQDKLYSIWLE
jgi:hypothetical protein